MSILISNGSLSTNCGPADESRGLVAESTVQRWFFSAKCDRCCCTGTCLAAYAVTGLWEPIPSAPAYALRATLAARGWRFPEPDRNGLDLCPKCAAPPAKKRKGKKT